MTEKVEIHNKEIRALVANLSHWQSYIREPRERYQRSQEMAQRVFGELVDRLFRQKRDEESDLDN